MLGGKVQEKYTRVGGARALLRTLRREKGKAGSKEIGALLEILGGKISDGDKKDLG